MVYTYSILKLYVFILLWQNVHLQTRIQQRLRQVNDYISELEDHVTSLENSRTQCDDNTASMTSSISQLQSFARGCSSRFDNLNQTLNTISRNIDNIDNTGGPDVDIMIVLDQSPDADTACMRVPDSLEQCIQSFEGEPIVITNAQIVCLQRLLWTVTPTDELEVSDIERLQQLVNLNNVERPNFSPREPRKEYRAMTLNERSRFHTAMQRVYDEGTLAVFGRLHGRAGRNAHGGPAFLPWHRAFISLFEQALREKDPRVSLPYWDSTLDNDMDNPTNSILWTEDFMGNGAGEVNTGPFAGWVGRNGRLERQFGIRSRLISNENFRAAMTQCFLREISRPFAQNQFDVESFHNGAHVWIGGEMAFPGTAAYDPIFYLHHAYIDYIWEQFRINQEENCNVDPTTDYPRNSEDFPIGQFLDSSMTQMNFFNVSGGLASWWTQGNNPWYSYEASPECPFCGQTDWLSCATDIDRCIPNSRLAEFIQDITEPAPVTAIPSSSSQNVPSSSQNVPSSASSVALTSMSGREPAIEINPPVGRNEIPQPRGVKIPQFIERDIAADLNLIPQNRGIQFQERSSDSRNIFTAVQDAISFAERRTFKK